MKVGREHLELLREAFELWLSRRAFQHAAALAFYTLFSMAPLLIVLITLIGMILGEDAARGEIAGRIDHIIGPQAATAVQVAVRRARFSEAGILPTILGISTLLFASTTAFVQLQDSLNQLWDVTARPSRSSVVVFLTSRLVSLGFVLVIGFLLLMSLLINTGLAAVVHFTEAWSPIPPGIMTALDMAASVIIVAVLFAVIFKILPDVRLHWRDMWYGAVVTAPLFVGGQWVISLYLTRVAPTSVYGAAGSLVVILFWVYYSSLILFFGAALTRARIRLRGDFIVPKPTAVKVRLEVVEDQP